MNRFRPKNRCFWLAHLFESNYGKLRELFPELSDLHGDAVALAHGKPALHLTLIERSRYTLTVELNYCFDRDCGRLIEPRFRIRVYLDGKCAEALSGTAHGTVATEATPRRRQCSDILEDKWSSNYFLERWLDHCLKNRYRFERSLAKEKPPVLA